MSSPMVLISFEHGIGRREFREGAEVLERFAGVLRGDGPIAVGGSVASAGLLADLCVRKFRQRLRDDESHLLGGLAVQGADAFVAEENAEIGAVVPRDVEPCLLRAAHLIRAAAQIMGRGELHGVSVFGKLEVVAHCFTLHATPMSTQRNRMAARPQNSGMTAPADALKYAPGLFIRPPRRALAWR